MEKKLNIESKEIVFASSDPRKTNEIFRLQKKGLIKKIAPRIYTASKDEDPKDIIRRNILTILGTLFPGSILSHRSAFEFKPTESNNIFVTYKYTKKLRLPGATVNFLKGPKPIEGDNKFVGELFVSQKERAYLENMEISKKIGGDSKTLSLPLIEEKLEQVLNVHGNEGLNKLRDRARELSNQLHLEKEFEKLNKLIGALLATKPIRMLSSPLAIARALGTPYDKDRIRLFEELFIALRNREFKIRPDQNSTPKSFRNFAFFESYFSNYIEGTQFTIEEAKEIIDTGVPLPSRDEDSHDILGTYILASNEKEMSLIPLNAEMLIKLLLTRHEILLNARTGKNPGRFKEKENRAGETYFVKPDLVRGTLIKGFEYYNALDDAFRRAAFMMFMISEVHPFDDGNGRIARLMMNAELVNDWESKILIPTVFRDDYILTLRKLSRQGDPIPYLDMLEIAHKFSYTVHAEDYEEMRKYLESCNAFNEPEDGKRLVLREH
jgi:hypothetical protein